MDYGVFNVRMDTNASNCTWGMHRHVRVCTESWPWEKNPLQHKGNRTYLSGILVRCSTNRATSPHLEIWQEKFEKKKKVVWKEGSPLMMNSLSGWSSIRVVWSFYQEFHSTGRFLLCAHGPLLVSQLEAINNGLQTSSHIKCLLFLYHLSWNV